MGEEVDSIPDRRVEESESRLPTQSAGLLLILLPQVSGIIRLEPQEVDRRQSDDEHDPGSQSRCKKRAAVALGPSQGAQVEADTAGVHRLEAHESLQVVRELVAARVALSRKRIHRPGDDRLQVSRYPGRVPPQGRDATTLDGVERRGRRAHLQRRPQRHGVIERGAQGVQVRARGDRIAPAAELLGRRVRDGAQEFAGPGLEVHLLVSHQAEVGEHRVAAAADQDVRGLDVPVQEPGALDFGQRTSDLNADPAHEQRPRARQVATARSEDSPRRRREARAPPWAPPDLFDQPRERHALDPVHREDARLAEPENVQDLVIPAPPSNKKKAASNEENALKKKDAKRKRKSELQRQRRAARSKDEKDFFDF